MKCLIQTCNRWRMISLAAASLLLISSASAADNPWKPVAGKMMTRWGKDVKPDNAWQEYPRPQFERKDWQNLNGLWNYAITPKDAAKPAEWPGKILVPFAVESS